MTSSRLRSVSYRQHRQEKREKPPNPALVVCSLLGVAAGFLLMLSPPSTDETPYSAGSAVRPTCTGL